MWNRKGKSLEICCGAAISIWWMALNTEVPPPTYAICGQTGPPCATHNKVMAAACIAWTDRLHLQIDVYREIVIKNVIDGSMWLYGVFAGIFCAFSPRSMKLQMEQLKVLQIGATDLGDGGPRMRGESLSEIWDTGETVSADDAGMDPQGHCLGTLKKLLQYEGYAI
ncbi:hypothetical protein ARMGADRAFT_1035328 [Armillaria gallica]|uniref:Uncharacterized protein n=1 Tax=Armillaria gallica TaxID=47427 RepID=A0A2H3DCG2_ARMGA|nr:hypothetical protein ARMGADRAFT_1035328 [Armillaria gallica]